MTAPGFVKALTTYPLQRNFQLIDQRDHLARFLRKLGSLLFVLDAVEQETWCSKFARNHFERCQMKFLDFI